MIIIDADKVFSKVDFHDDIDYYTYPLSIYECYICKNLLSFKMQNFMNYSFNKKSIFTTEIQEKITKEAKRLNRKESNSFIDFFCPKCNLSTRIYFTTWFGGKFTFASHLDFIVIDACDGNNNAPQFSDHPQK